MRTLTNINVPLETYHFDRQVDLAIFAGDTIMIEKFPEMERIGFRSFDSTFDKDIENFHNEIFSIKSQNEEFISKVTLKVSLIRLGAHYPKMGEIPYKKFVDYMQEFLNQFQGVVNQNIQSSIGMYFRIGLPTHICGEGLPLVENGENLIIPGVRIVDNTGTFDLNLGYVRIKGSSNIDLSGVDFTLMSEDEDDLELF